MCTSAAARRVGGGAADAAAGGRRSRGAERRAIRGRIETGEDPRARNHLGVLRVIERHLDDVELYSEFVGSAGSVPFLHPAARWPGGQPVARDVEVDDVLSVGLGTTVCVCEPLQVCTFLMSFGACGFDTSKMRTPAMWSFGSCTPPFPQSLRLPAPSAEMNSRLPTIDGSPCDVMHSMTDATTGFAGSVTSQIVNPGEVALVHVVRAERQIGVDERQAACRVELRRLRRERHEVHAALCGAGVEPARLEVAAGIGGARIRLPARHSKRAMVARRATTHVGR